MGPSLSLLGLLLAAGGVMEVRMLPSLVISWALLPRPSLDNKLLAGGIYFASQVSLGLFRALTPIMRGWVLLGFY